MKQKETYVKICPKCGSVDISPFTKLGLSEGEHLIDFCKNCNYGYLHGGFFPEVEESKIAKFRKEIKELLLRSTNKTFKKDIYAIIETGDEKELKKHVMALLKSVIDGTGDKNELSYFPSFLITIPLEFGWKDNYIVKDKILDNAINTIANFEGDTEEEAKNKSKKLLKKLEEK